jgi:hypothetical protein
LDIDRSRFMSKFAFAARSTGHAAVIAAEMQDSSRWP